MEKSFSSCTRSGSAMINSGGLARSPAPFGKFLVQGGAKVLPIDCILSIVSSCAHENGLVTCPSTDRLLRLRAREPDICPDTAAALSCTAESRLRGRDNPEHTSA